LRSFAAATRLLTPPDRSFFPIAGSPIAICSRKPVFGRLGRSELSPCWLPFPPLESSPSYNFVSSSKC
jgi:hypothetical protein